MFYRKKKVNPSKTSSSSSKKCLEEDNKSIIEPSAPDDEAELGSAAECPEIETEMLRVPEVKRSKSRVRSYLKKCKERFTGGSNVHQEEVEPENLPAIEMGGTSVAWYIDEKPSAVIRTLELDDNTTEQVTAGEENPILDSGMAELVDKYLSNLYPLYYERTRAILMRQARDLLVCTYFGCLKTFEENFLIVFTQIAANLKSKHSAGESLSWSKGWPLATESGDVILHLGSVDESFVRPQDIYICIKPTADNSNPELYVVWRSIEPPLLPTTTTTTIIVDNKSAVTTATTLPSLTQAIRDRVIDSKADLLSPLSLDMLTDELPQLLQSLLVGVERAIKRIPLNELTFPKQQQQSTEPVAGGATPTAELLNLPKCPLKRSDLITKNKMINNKYHLRRFTTKYNDSSGGGPPPAATTDLQSAANLKDATPSLPVFCLGNSFPHIDSDEENSSDERKASTVDNQMPEEEIIAPRSILELPEKLLTSGIYLPGTCDLNARPIITIDANCVTKAGLNCYEVATVLLYYSTIPDCSSSAYTILLQLEANSDLPVIEIICNSLNLCAGHLRCEEILAICLDKNLLNCRPTNCDNKLVKLITTDQISRLISPFSIPKKCGGHHQHDQNKWREFFQTIDPFQSQCLATGQRLIAAMGDIRTSDQQGLPTRRQLYSQHRALSRALMDTELHYLRKRGADTLNRLQELAKYFHKSNNNNNNSNSSNSNSNNIYTKSLPMEDGAVSKSTPIQTENWGCSNEDITGRLNKVMVLFNEVDRAAKRLEQLTEQRRERLRELTRQCALEDEMNEVSVWLQTDGEERLQRFTNVQLDCEDVIKDHEQDFEKYYFISMKHLAKGSDLHDAAIELDALKENATNLKSNLKIFSDRLERAREKIEGASRLHHLLGLQIREDDLQLEMQRLADKIGVPGLIEKYRIRRISHQMQQQQHHQLQLQLQQTNGSTIGVGLDKLSMKLVSSTPDRLKSPTDEVVGSCHCWRSPISATTTPTSGIVSNQPDFSLTGEKTANNETHGDEDEEEHSKIADSGLGGCERCDGNTKLSRVCSCQSFEEAGNLCDKSHNSDELEEDCFERNSKQFLDAHSPIEANSHLQCHASNLDLPQMEELCRLDPKIQKQLLLIIREMIVTERDYVRSLYYVIENYVDELLRDDIPQAMRGQRNVIFGNIEKIFEFHQPHFLTELEQYESNPLKVGAAFLENEAKFYLYALYNKNKPKSDTLMSEYGTTFFKSKQMELNDKMDLASYLLKPVQRMGKYALLLQQLVKACNNVTGPVFQDIAADVEELQRAEEMVKFQLRHGNDLLAMDSLRDCDVNVKEQGRLLRQNEFLVWQGRGGKKCLRQIFLFEELVLFSKARRFPDHKNLDIYIYKNSIKTSDIGLTAHVSDSATKFEIWFRKRKPEDTWTLQSMSEDIKNAWTDEVSRLLWKQAKRNREIRLAEMSSMGIGNKPCLDIRPSHNQISDRSITISQLGKAPKLRHSFAGTLPDTNKTANRRPNSLISESSMSSGTSSSSLSTGSGGNNCKNPGGLELINETTTLNLTGNVKKHQRSTTLVSQLSMESGIMSDISMTPDTETHHEPNWTTSLSRKSSSTNSSKSSKSVESTSSTNTSNSSSSSSSSSSGTNCNNSNCKNINNKNTKNNCNKKKQQHLQPKLPTNSELNLAEQDPYVGDSVTVHL